MLTTAVDLLIEYQKITRRRSSQIRYIIDARELFGDLQRATRVQRFEAELAAFERQCPDRARTFIDMFQAVAWARQHPRSAIYSILMMDDDQPEQVYVSRLARTLYGRRASK